jgi:hypothetical protein
MAKPRRAELIETLARTIAVLFDIIDDTAVPISVCRECQRLADRISPILQRNTGEF